MAITATIAMSSATVNAEQTSTATVTVTNTGATALNVTQMEPYVVPHSGTSQAVAVAVGRPPVGGNFGVSIAGSNGTRLISFDVTPHAPPGNGLNAEPAQYVYDVGCIVTTSDGTVTTATTTTLTVNYVGH